jgi:hypothetical protein
MPVVNKRLLRGPTQSVEHSHTSWVNGQCLTVLAVVAVVVLLAYDLQVIVVLRRGLLAKL